MIVMSYSESRARYAEVLDRATLGCEEVVVTRAGKESAVIVALEEWEALKETAHLLSSPANVVRITQSVERVEAGRIQSHNLIEV